MLLNYGFFLNAYIHSTVDTISATVGYIHCDIIVGTFYKNTPSANTPWLGPNFNEIT